MTTKTVTIIIGNSDNKLTQELWSKFIAAVDNSVSMFSVVVHFSGYSNPVAPWQNAAWVFDVEEEMCSALEHRLTGVRAAFGQDSVAWIDEQRTRMI